jgi:hypothetical protein
MLCPTQGSREATPSSDNEISSDIATHDTQEGAKGDRKRRKHRFQETTTDDNDDEVGGFDVRRISIAACSDKHQVRPPMDHFKRLLEEACPNHAYLTMHKLMECNMMRSFMTSGCLTWGAELDKGLDETDMTPFPKENTVMTVYGGRPRQGGAACLA